MPAQLDCEAGRRRFAGRPSAPGRSGRFDAGPAVVCQSRPRRSDRLVPVPRVEGIERLYKHLVSQTPLPVTWPLLVLSLSPCLRSSEFREETDVTSRNDNTHTSATEKNQVGSESVPVVPVVQLFENFGSQRPAHAVRLERFLRARRSRPDVGRQTPQPDLVEGRNDGDLAR